MGDAMGLAINLFERSEVNERVMIVLTDGNDTGSLIPPERVAEIARDNDVVVHTVAIGDPEAVGEQALDEKTLANIATITGGGYFHANDREELEEIYSYLDDINPRQVETQSYRPVRDIYYWPLAVAVLASLMYFMLRELRLLLRRRRSIGADKEATA